MEETKRRGIAAAASTDAHFPWEFGRAYTEMPSFADVDGFRKALRHARPVGKRLGSPILHVGSRMVADVRRFYPEWRRASTASSNT
jgi:hypothetical protein